MRRSPWPAVFLALTLALAACRPDAQPTLDELATRLCGVWLDPITGWTYVLAADGSYTGRGPLLADGVNRLSGQYRCDAEGYVELSLAQRVPRRALEFYERQTAWHVEALSDEQATLTVGRLRVRLVRRDECPATVEQRP